MNYPVGPFAMGSDAPQIVGHVLGDLFNEALLLLGQPFAGFIKDLPKLLQELFRGLGEVLDEVQGVPDLMGNAGRKLAQRRQFFPRHDLVLGRTQLDQHAFKLFVLALQLFGQLLHQVQALDLQGMSPEDLESGGHFGYLVSSADLDAGFQVAAGHAAHPIR